LLRQRAPSESWTDGFNNTPSFRPCGEAGVWRTLWPELTKADRHECPR